MIKQLFCELERKTTFPRQEEITTEGVLDKTWKDFSKKFRKFSFSKWWFHNTWVFKTNNERNGCFGALQRAQSQLASVCTLSSCVVVWSCMRRYSGQELKRLPMARRASASTHEMCASPTQCCFGATRWWWCDASHVGLLRTLAPYSVATIFLVFILAVLVSQKGQSSSSLPWCHHLVKASDCRYRRGDSGGQQQQTCRSSVSSTTCGSLARRAPSCTTKWLQNVGFLPPQWPRWSGSSSVWSRRVWRDVERATCPRPGCLFSVRASCLHVPSNLVFRCCNGPDQEFFLIDQEHHVKRPEFIACGWIAVRVPLPKRQEEWLDYVGTKGNGHRGGFTRRAVEAWHVQCRHVRSGAFDNVRSHRFCILLGSAQFQSVRGHLEALQCVATMLLEQRVPSPPGNLYVPGVKPRAAGFFITFVSVSANAINAINAGSKIFEKQI